MLRAGLEYRLALISDRLDATASDSRAVALKTGMLFEPSNQPLGLRVLPRRRSPESYHNPEVNMKVFLALLSALALTACSGASMLSFQSRMEAQVAKVKELAPAYCRIRPQMSLDDLALAGIALATSEKAADVIKAGVDKVCSWVGEPVSAI